MLMVTSNHCPRLTESGAVIFGVCFGSKDVPNSLNSGVNCSSCVAPVDRPVSPGRTTLKKSATAKTVPLRCAKPFVILFPPKFKNREPPMLRLPPPEHVIGQHAFLLSDDS